MPSAGSGHGKVFDEIAAALENQLYRTAIRIAAGFA